MEAATDYAILITDAQDRITDWLPGAEAVFGYTADEALGHAERPLHHLLKSVPYSPAT